MTDSVLVVATEPAPVLTIDGMTYAVAVAPVALNILAVAEQGPQGPGGAAAGVLTFPIAAAASFTATHTFAYRPRAWLIDASGAEVETDVLHAPAQVTLVFPAPFTGTLYLG